MDWQLTCRVCLESGDMVSLFDCDENNQQLSDKYTYCCGVSVPANDNLPTLICLGCVDKLAAAYQFRQQCLVSNDTLKECLEEFIRTNTASPTDNTTLDDTDLLDIKQENGVFVKYELPMESSDGQWTRTVVKTPNSTVVTKAPGPRKRGRPRKYPNEQGQIDVSPYQRKKPKEVQKEPEALTTLLANGALDLKEEIEEKPIVEDYEDADPDFLPDMDSDLDIEPKPAQMPRKRGRPRKLPQEIKVLVKSEEPDDDMVKETMLTVSEPLREYLVNPKSKKKYASLKKKYSYEKTHTCETCGASFTSNASLQAHIRRHLGIKPFVCSVCGYACVLNMELRRHMMRHTGHRPYKCRVCDRRFGDYGSRQKHERLHMGVRPYQCSLCGKSFTYSYVLANHMLTHTGEKKYSCGPCNKKFTKAHHLKYHNKVHHKDLYIQQQLELEAKKVRRQMNVTGLSGVISGQIVDGTLQLLQSNSEDGDNGSHLQVLGEEHEDDVKETDRAVASMQAVRGILEIF